MGVTASGLGARHHMRAAFLQAPEWSGEAGGPQLEGERAAALFLPSATASWRLNLLRSGGLPDHRIASLECAPESPATAIWPHAQELAAEGCPTPKGIHP